MFISGRHGLHLGCRSCSEHEQRFGEAGLGDAVEEAMDGFGTCFAGLSDRRSVGSQRHDLREILMIALCAVLSGGQTAVDMAVFAEAKQEFLRSFLRLKNGFRATIPSAACFANSIPTNFVPVFRNSSPASAKPVVA
jgi:hypothetical protein